MSNAKILIVDDEQTIVNTVRAYLEPEGYTVYTAADGPAALKAVRSFRPDLVILDIMLPVSWPNTLIRRDSDQAERGITPPGTDTKLRSRECFVQRESSLSLSKQMKTERTHPVVTFGCAYGSGRACSG